MVAATEKPVNPVRRTGPDTDSLAEDARSVAAILAASDGAARESHYRHLVLKYWKVVNVIVSSRLGDAREAEDVAQEAFLRAFTSLGSLSRPDAFVGWLLRIARNLATDRLRKRRTVVSMETLGDGMDGSEPLARRSREPDPSSSLETAEEIRLVLDALQTLPDPYREVVVLKYLESLDGKSMARALGEPEGTVRNRLFRALEMLRERVLRKGARSP
jgi:RNA polymerase sigma-70 factor (ECF subfamily)